jgi:hypothetical protein
LYKKLTSLIKKIAEISQEITGYIFSLLWNTRDLDQKPFCPEQKPEGLKQEPLDPYPDCQVPDLHRHAPDLHCHVPDPDLKSFWLIAQDFLLKNTSTFKHFKKISCAFGSQQILFVTLHGYINIFVVSIVIFWSYIFVDGSLSYFVR